MITIQQILCPIDFSDFSRHALDHAAAIARWYDATVTVLHVVPPVLPPAPAAGTSAYLPAVFTPEDLDRFRSTTEAFARQEIGDAHVTAVAREGSVVGEIVNVADTLPADLVVMGTHGRTGFEHLMLGSVTERVLRKAPCPVLTVPRRAPDAMPLPVAFKRILCGVDFSPSSLKALRYAMSLAEEADAALTLLHVVERYVFEPAPMSVGTVPLDIDMHNVALERLREVVPAEARAYATIREEVAIGKPYREILREAQEQRAELIVVGAHGGGLGAPGFGSTTNQIVRQATCPVLSLKA